MSNDVSAGLPIRHLMVLPGTAFRATHGVNEGDPLADAADLVPDDTYELSREATPSPLALSMDAQGAFSVGAGSAVGTPGAPVFLDSLLTLMTPDGTTAEAMVLVEVDADSGTIAAVHLYPLTTLTARLPYTLVTISRDNLRTRLAEAASLCFTRGTRITMGDGRQKPVEELVAGDRVLTRDSGVQEVRWVGTQTVRAEGNFAPIRISAGALNNLGDLVVSPNHRLFIYQRVAAMGAGHRELLVKAKLLVNGTSVTQTPGGFVEYVQVLFDQHEVIYVEGIAAESLFADTSVRPALPEEVTRRLAPAKDEANALGAFELGERDMRRGVDPVELLRRISAG